MRFPDKEQFHFGHPCWTSGDLRAYSGPIFRAQVYWYDEDGKRWNNDHECPSMAALHECVNSNLESQRSRRRQAHVTYGDHTIINQAGEYVPAK